MDEGGRHFAKESSVHQTLQKIAHKLDALGIPYAVAGAMAMFQHGYRRFTEDVDLLVTREGLRQVHEHLEGLGYVKPFAGSKNLRDTETGVRIEFLISGDYPGDGKPKPVAFPQPPAASIEADGIRYLKLVELIQLKLASGISNPKRMKDISDIRELISVLNLPESLADHLNAYVRPKYLELCKLSRKRYVMLWRNKFLTTEAKSIEEMAARLREAAAALEAMKAAGVELDEGGGAQDDYAHLVTTDPEVAKRFDMMDEEELWPDEEPDATNESPDAAPSSPD